MEYIYIINLLCVVVWISVEREFNVLTECCNKESIKWILVTPESEDCDL